MRCDNTIVCLVTYLFIYEELMELFPRDHAIIVGVDNAKFLPQFLDLIVLKSRFLDPFGHSGEA